MIDIVMPVLDLHAALDALSENLGLSTDDLARVVGASGATVKRWRTGSHLPQGESRKRLNDLWDLKERLEGSFESAADVRSWLNARSRYLGDFTPREALLLGRVDRVNAALEALDSGVFL
jgi:ribosome-binding protein aMBF1 (putative translation factor)